MAKEMTDLEKIKRQLRKMALGKAANDCVKLALCEDVEVGKLDLSMLSEIKKSERGGVEVKLLDRLEALEQLARLADEENPEAEELWKALLGKDGEETDADTVGQAEKGDAVVEAEQSGQPV